MRTWVFLLYTLPPEPSAPRVQLWRKLKRLGALLLHNTVWVLPATPATIEQMQWLAQEIAHAEGSASVWLAQASLAGDDEALVQQFTAQAESAYAQLQEELNRHDAELSVLARRYRQVQMRDYFHAPGSEQLRRSFQQAREHLVVTDTDTQKGAERRDEIQ